MKQHKIGIIGLGYVGLPLAIAFNDKYSVIGYDIDTDRLSSISQNVDSGGQLNKETLEDAFNNTFKVTGNIEELNDCSVYIITVPTPVNFKNKPDFSFLENASRKVASQLSKGDIIVYESTVYPGATEEICIPILEETSQFELNKDFYVGYSPERINVGDNHYTFKSIPKIVSASDPAILKDIESLYSSIITAEIYCAPSIKVAEAAKVIENTQRDVNIAFVNELAMMFSKMGIDTEEVLKAASTKWNFQMYKPGLVGGHCIGIDPYYLAHKSKLVGYTPNLLLSAREVNERVPCFIVDRIINLLKEQNKQIEVSKALILGASFKENVSDLRNSKSIALAQLLFEKGAKVSIFDPYIEKKSLPKELNLIEELDKNSSYDFIILAVSHDIFKSLNPKDYLTEKGFVYDIKQFFSPAPFIHYF